MKKNLDITKPRYSEQILPVTVSWPFVIPRFHGNCFCWIFNSMKRGFVVARAPLGGAHITLLWSGTAYGKDHKDTLPQTRTHQVFWYYEMVTLVWERPDPQKLMINQIVTSDCWSKFCISKVAETSSFLEGYGFVRYNNKQQQLLFLTQLQGCH